MFGSVVLHLLYPALFVCLLLASIPSAPAQTSPSHDDSNRSTESDLLEIGSAKQLKPVTTTSREFKVLSYNIRWRAGDDLKKMIELFKTDAEIGGASVLALQEVDRNKKRTNQTNTAKLIADELGMHYAWTAPPTSKKEQEEETGVAILSSYPLHDIRRLVLPHPGPGKRRRVALGATIKIGDTPIRVYSVHSENRTSIDNKVEQMKASIDDLATFPGPLPAIIMGDMNTWEAGAGDATKKLFKKANFHTPFDGSSTFCRRIVFVDLKLKLDWVWLRDFEVTRFGIDRDIDYSDHWPLWVVVKLKDEPPKAAAQQKP
jgi:endonuclease/exonuclease/phosphatase family metal-dependent hydrolase